MKIKNIESSNISTIEDVRNVLINNYEKLLNGSLKVNETKKINKQANRFIKDYKLKI